MEQDARIPVIFGQQPGADDMVLLEEGLTAPASVHILQFTTSLPGHLPGCSCCTGRSPAATALAAAFRARAMGESHFFKQLIVISTPAGKRAIKAALTQDALCRARFRLSGEDEM